MWDTLKGDWCTQTPTFVIEFVFTLTGRGDGKSSFHPTLVMGTLTYCSFMLSTCTLGRVVGRKGWLTYIAVSAHLYLLVSNYALVPNQTLAPTGSLVPTFTLAPACTLVHVHTNLLLVTCHFENISDFKNSKTNMSFSAFWPTLIPPHCAPHARTTLWNYYFF